MVTADVNARFDEAAESLGGLDVLAHPAAIQRSGTASDVTVEDWDLMFAVNVRGTMLTNQAAHRLMAPHGGGSIINFGSISGLRPEAIAEYAGLAEHKRERIRQLRLGLERTLAGSDHIQRDPIWEAKIEALRVVYDEGLSEVRHMAKEHFVRAEGRPLAQFATWCALVNTFGMNWRDWPVEYRRPSSPQTRLRWCHRTGRVRGRA